MKLLLADIILKLSNNHKIRQIASILFKKKPTLKIKIIDFTDKLHITNYKEDNRIIYNEKLLEIIKNEIENKKNREKINDNIYRHNTTRKR